MIHVLNKNNSILNQFLLELRDKKIQRDRMRFRRNLERIGEIAGYELSKTLNYTPKKVATPLGDIEINVLDKMPVLATILRAGLPLHQGLLNYFDHTDNAFVSAFRKTHKDGEFEVKVEYLSCPDLNDRVLVLSDPMLATGTSMLLSYKALIGKGKPSDVHIVVAIASEEGLDFIRKHIPKAKIWVGAVDAELTAKAYIVPGLGDAGDLAYGEKD